MIDFSVWSTGDAEMYLDAYAASLPSRQEWLAAEIGDSSGDPDMLSLGEAGLDPLWAWATNLIDTGPSTLELCTPQPPDDRQPGARPPWYDQSTRDPWLSDGTLWLIELLGVHLACLVIEGTPHARWGVHQDPRQPDDYFQNRTMLVGANPRPIDPSGMIHTSVIGHVLRGKTWLKQPTLSSLYAFVTSG